MRSPLKKGTVPSAARGRAVGWGSRQERAQRPAERLEVIMRSSGHEKTPLVQRTWVQLLGPLSVHKRSHPHTAQRSYSKPAGQPPT